MAKTKKRRIGDSVTVENTAAVLKKYHDSHRISETASKRVAAQADFYKAPKTVLTGEYDENEKQIANFGPRVLSKLHITPGERKPTRDDYAAPMNSGAQGNAVSRAKAAKSRKR